ncbi:retrotransposon gag protein [Cucumis melo var. makuwa]|uniref:Retrotransposon gag protein n=1 Tax=Cucumis melo var. makuwa TaxID=1194695 RepID=A0A5A7U6G4_CUCMM|nr:retrotransposon gag protein [Cucumis melo var. makuwa]TYK12132.1 retrotransposon gag protein [Cucumis melo var. makuwa]
MAQLTTAISKTDGKGKLPTQPDHANVSAISLRSGKILDTSTTKEIKETSKPLPLNSKNESKEEKVETNSSPSDSKNDKSPLNDCTPYIPKPPFPSRLAPKKKETPKEEELLPLLDAIQLAPSRCNSTSPEVCKVSKGVVYQQEENKRKSNGKSKCFGSSKE